MPAERGQTFHQVSSRFFGDKSKQRCAEQSLRRSKPKKRRACVVRVEHAAFSMKRDCLWRMFNEIPESRLALLERFGCCFRLAYVAHYPQDFFVSERRYGPGEPHGFSLQLERVFDVDSVLCIQCLRDG